MTATRKVRWLWALLALALVLTAPLPVRGADLPVAPPAESPDPLVPPQPACLGAILVDYDTGEVYLEKNADTPRPIASMTKVMTLYLVLEAIADGRLTRDQFVPAGYRAAAISNDPKYSGMEKLVAGNRYAVDTLMALAMVHSCNGSAVVLAEAVAGSEWEFTRRMNEKAAEWGIDARFADCSGYEDRGNAVSPRAMAEIVRRVLTDYPQILNYSSLPAVEFHGEIFGNSNTMMTKGEFPGIDGLKTGFTYGAGSCFAATASRDGRRVISVVMGARDHTARMEESRALLEHGFARRQEREEERERLDASLLFSITPDQSVLYPYQTVTFTASLLCPEDLEVDCAAHWEVDGRPLGAGQEVTLADGAVLTARAAIPPDTDALRVALVLTLPYGGTLRREREFPVTPQPNTFRNAVLRPADANRVPDMVLRDQGEAFVVLTPQ